MELKSRYKDRTNLLSEENAFEAFNKERLLKQHLCLKLLIKSDFDGFEKILIELIDNAINNNLPSEWIRMQIYALIEIILMVSCNFYSKIDEITVNDILSYKETKKFAYAQI